MADNIKKIKIQAVGLKDIKRELEGIKSAMKDATDPSDMSRLTSEADKLEGKLGEVNDKVKEFGEESTDSLNGAGKSVANLRTNIKNLDFKAIQAQAVMFAAAARKITFKGAIKSLKSLAKTFLTVGKALLSNPLFWLAAVIVGIVVALYKFLDSLGLISLAIDALMAPIQYIIDLFYMLTDAIGLTNDAATKSAQATADAYSDSADALSKSTDSIVQDLDHQIAMATLNGESIVELEKEKTDAIVASAEAAELAARKQLEAQQVALEKKFKLTDEEIEELEKLEEAHRQATLTMQGEQNKRAQNDLKASKDRQKRIKEQVAELEKQATDEAKSAEDRRVAANEARAKRLAAEKAFQADRLAAIRLTEDLALQLTEEGIEKEITLNKTKYERLIEDAIANENLTEEEKLAIKKQYLALQEEAEVALIDKVNQKDIDKAKELNQRLFDITASDDAKAIAKIQEQNDLELEIFKESLENKLLSQEEYEEKLIELKKRTAEQIKAVTAEVAEVEVEIAEMTLQEKIDMAGQYMSIATQGLDAISSLMQTSMDNEIAAAEGNEKKQEQLRKKGFEQQKKMQIAAAFINMAQGVVAGLGAPFPMNIAMPIIAGITGAASIAKIKSTTYQGGGGGAITPPTTTPNMDVGGQGRQAPVVNFQGSGSNSNDVGAGGGSSYTIENTVTVSETEITDKQRTVKNLTAQSQL